jgi:hypothetical protein
MTSFLLCTFILAINNKDTSTIRSISRLDPWDPAANTIPTISEMPRHLEANNDSYKYLLRQGCSLDPHPYPNALPMFSPQDVVDVVEEELDLCRRVPRKEVVIVTTPPSRALTIRQIIVLSQSPRRRRKHRSWRSSISLQIGSGGGGLDPRRLLGGTVGIALAAHIQVGLVLPQATVVVVIGLLLPQATAATVRAVDEGYVVLCSRILFRCFGSDSICM